MGLVRALHNSRSTNYHPELCNSKTLDLSSVLPLDVSTATNARQNHQKKGINYQKIAKGLRGGERQNGKKRERKREREQESTQVSEITLGRHGREKERKVEFEMFPEGWAKV